MHKISLLLFMIVICSFSVPTFAFNATAPIDFRMQQDPKHIAGHGYIVHSGDATTFTPTHDNRCPAGTDTVYSAHVMKGAYVFAVPVGTNQFITVSVTGFTECIGKNGYFVLLKTNE